MAEQDDDGGNAALVPQRADGDTQGRAATALEAQGGRSRTGAYGLHSVLTKPAKERYGDVIYDQIIAQISSGAFPVGFRLPSEKEFAGIFDVSRPTVRQAIKRLQSDGVIVSRRGSGHVVRRVPPAGLSEIADKSSIADMLRCFEARQVLEGETARLAAIRGTNEDIERLRLGMADMRVEYDTGAIRAEVDMAFHASIAAASANRHLLDLFNHLAPRIRGGVAVTLSFTRAGTRERAQRVLDEHERIIEAICDRDGESASLAMRYHLDQARRRLMDGSRPY